MVLIVIAGINAGLYHWKVDPILSTMDRNSESPPIAKLVAFTSLFAWISVLLLGRLIPYVGTGQPQLTH